MIDFAVAIIVGIAATKATIDDKAGAAHRDDAGGATGAASDGQVVAASGGWNGAQAAVTTTSPRRCVVVIDFATANRTSVQCSLQAPSSRRTIQRVERRGTPLGGLAEWTDRSRSGSAPRLQVASPP